MQRPEWHSKWVFKRNGFIFLCESTEQIGWASNWNARYSFMAFLYIFTVFWCLCCWCAMNTLCSLIPCYCFAQHLPAFTFFFYDIDFRSFPNYSKNKINGNLWAFQSLWSFSFALQTFTELNCNNSYIECERSQQFPCIFCFFLRFVIKLVRIGQNL